MTDYELIDPTGYWCPGCGEPRSLCCCNDYLAVFDDDEDDGYDPNICPECGGDVTVEGDWVFCADTNNCGWRG